MSLKRNLQQDLEEAQKSRDILKVSVLRMLLAAIINKEKEKRAKLAKGEKQLNEEELVKQSQLTDEEIIEVVSSETKKRKEAITGFKKGGRDEQVEQEKKELEILMEYMPEQMTEKEIHQLVQKTIQEIGASGPQDIGKIMSALMPQLKGKADGSLVSKIVQEELSKL